MKRKSILVTIANEAYLEQAKQLFSSAYHHGKWSDACMLITDVREQKLLSWFSSKGILVRTVTLPKVKFRDNFPSAVAMKSYIFSPAMKIWDVVIYLDVDIIIKKELQPLTRLSGMHAVEDINTLIIDQISYPFTLREHLITWSLSKMIDLFSPAFNTGVIVFTTDMINRSSFHILLLIMRLTSRITRFGDQLAINILWRGRWKTLPLQYNYYPYQEQKVAAPTIVHLCDKVKPWNKKSPLYREWRENYLRANDISFL